MFDKEEREFEQYDNAMIEVLLESLNQLELLPPDEAHKQETALKASIDKLINSQPTRKASYRGAVFLRDFRDLCIYRDEDRGKQFIKKYIFKTALFASERWYDLREKFHFRLLEENYRGTDRYDDKPTKTAKSLWDEMILSALFVAINKKSTTYPKNPGIETQSNKKRQPVWNDMTLPSLSDVIGIEQENKSISLNKPLTPRTQKQQSIHLSIWHWLRTRIADIFERDLRWGMSSDLYEEQDTETLYEDEDIDIPDETAYNLTTEARDEIILPEEGDTRPSVFSWEPPSVERRETLLEAVEEILNEKERLVVLFYQGKKKNKTYNSEGYSDKELAQKLGETPANIRKIRQRALEKIRKAIK